MLTHGQTSVLREHLDSNGAVTICDAAELNNFATDDLRQGFLSVPHDMQPDFTSLPETAGELSLVSYWWVERCLHGKCMVDPTEYVLSKPLEKISISGVFPPPHHSTCRCANVSTGFERLTINSTGFPGIELLHVTKAVAWFGMCSSVNLLLHRH